MRVHGTDRLARLLLALAAVAALADFAGCSSTGGPTPGVQPIHASGRYVHAPSGVEFPESFGEFDRVEINQYEDSEAKIGVGYNLEQADTQIALTVFVYPPTLDETGAPLSLAKQFEIERANVLQYHPGVTAGATWTPPPTQNHETTRGYAATFHYPQEFAYHRQDAESLLYLFEVDGWVVKYRITYPSSQQARANPIAQVFVSSFPWRGGT